ncbi:MAG: MerC domain-containing protein [Candidatus Manganitrophaceae bacterium]
MLKEKAQIALDRWGVLISGICLFHCLLTPLAIVLFPVVSLAFTTDESFHRTLLWLVLPTSVFAFSLGCFRHKDRGVLVLGSAGLIQMILAAHFGHDMLGEIGERIATSMGGMTLVLGHLRNYRLCREDRCHT